MKRSTSLKRTAFQRKPAAGLTGILSASSFQRTRKAPKMKSRGMKGRTPTPEEQRFMNAIGKQGCVACRKDGMENLHISLHHVAGRTKPGAHYLVLPLCAQHHQQDDSDPMGRISVHGNKARFEARYGTQLSLVDECTKLAGVFA